MRKSHDIEKELDCFKRMTMLQTNPNPEPMQDCTPKPNKGFVVLPSTTGTVYGK